MIAISTDRNTEGLRAAILGLGVECQRMPLHSADISFEGNGENGLIQVGIERKKLNDLLVSMRSGRLSGHQLIKLGRQYQVRALLIEGIWKPYKDGTVSVRYSDDAKWVSLAHSSKPVMYSELRRFILSIQLSGVVTTFTRDLQHTAVEACEFYHYFQKKWHDHTSLMQLQKFNIPHFSKDPPVVRYWAEALTGIGSTYGELAAKYFGRPIRLANSDEEDWLKVGVRPEVAQQIVKSINGW